MFLPCATFGAHLYLMTQKEDWQVSDVVDLDCHYDDSVSFEIASLRGSGIDDLMVHHVAEAWGSGLSQQNFKVFAISSDGFKEVLDTEEVLVAYPYDGPERHELSSFVVVPTKDRSATVIEETRSVSVGSVLSVQRRYFRWSNNVGRYKASAFVAVRPTGD